MTQEKIVVKQSQRPVEFLNDAGNVEVLGNLISRTYLGEDVQRHEFEATRTDRSYLLGTSREGMQFINHVEGMQVLHDHGYVKRDMVLTMGGTELFAVWDNPEGVTYDDPILWDKSIWDHRSELGGTMTESIIQRGSIRPGLGTSFQRGFFRGICSNGLVAELLSLGRVRYNVSNWSPANLEEDLFGQDVAVLKQEQLMGERVGTNRSVARFGELLKTLRQTEDRPEYLASLPKFVRPMVAPFARVPKWFLESVEKQTELFVASGLKDVHELDVSNILTNAVNITRFGDVPEGEEREARSPNFMITNMNSLTEKAGSLIGVYSL